MAVRGRPRGQPGVRIVINSVAAGSPTDLNGALEVRHALQSARRVMRHQGGDEIVAIDVEPVSRLVKEEVTSRMQSTSVKLTVKKPDRTNTVRAAAMTPTHPSTWQNGAGPVRLSELAAAVAQRAGE